MDRARLIAFSGHLWRALLLVAIVAAAGWSGLWTRDWLWEQTQNVRFHPDIDNGFSWGREALAVGYFNVYDRQGESLDRLLEGDGGGRVIDYAPLRLGLMSAWVRWLGENDGPLDTRRPTLQYHQPLLRFNTFMEAAASVASFLIARLIVRRRVVARTACNGMWIGTWTGLSAALVTWFNPLILYNAHAWPQWDVWAVPGFLFAVYFGLRRWWLMAGVAIGLTSMLKGQVMVVAWTIPVWALVVAEWRSLLGLRRRNLLDPWVPVLGPVKFALGVAAAIAVIGWPWELTTQPLVEAPALGGLDAWLGRVVDYKAVAWVGLWVLAAVLLPRRFSPTLLCLALAGSLFSTLPFAYGEPGQSVRLFSGTNHWLQSAFGIGTVHFNTLFMGTTSNLPVLLVETFGFPREPADRVVNFFGHPVVIKQLLLAIFALLSLYSAVMAGVLDRLNSRYVVLAVALPWLLFYLIPAQIHERYLLYVAACSGIFLAAGVEWLLLGGVLTVAGLIATVHTAFGSSRTQIQGADFMHQPFEFFSWSLRLCEGARPGIAWMVLLAAAMLLYRVLPLRPMRGTAG